MKKNKRIIAIIMILSIVITNPLCVYAIDSNQLTVEQKKANISYQLNEKETFAVIYNKENLDEKIIEYIKNELNCAKEDIKLIKENGMTYQVIKNGELLYSGTVDYNYTKNINIDLLDKEPVDTIKEYIKTKYEYENIEVINKNKNTFQITINSVSYDFDITFNEEKATTYANDNLSINYATHVESIGWQEKVENGNLSGTIGKGLQVEAIKIDLLGQGDIGGTIEYQTHVESIGWQDYVQNGKVSGTTGRGLRTEAIRIRLTGEIAEQYDVYYRVHSETVGWLDWTSNGASAGTSGFARQMEAVEIKLVKKGTFNPENTENAYLQKEATINYATHVESIGWQEKVENGNLSGTIGKGLQVEAIKIDLLGQGDIGGTIEYQTHVESIGWQDYVQNGKVSGTTGRGLRTEAIRIRLTGEMAEQYDIYYRVHSETVGWLDWTSNGASAGTSGFARQMEAIEIKLVKKGNSPPITGENAYIEKSDSVMYSSHVEKIGWQEAVKNGELSGTTGEGKQIEGLKISLEGTKTGTIKYQTYIESVGWQNYVQNGELSGTTGQGKQIEAIKILLDGNIEKLYDIYYRVHVSSVGWLDWASNGATSGSSGIDKAIEAIEIKLVVKNAEAPGKTTKPSVEGKWIKKDGLTYYYDYFGNMASDFKFIDGKKYFFNSLGTLIVTDAKRVIDISAHNGTVDWDMVKNSREIDAVILRVAAGSATEDSQLARNVSELKRLGIPYGIYIYSYAEDQVGTVPGLGTMNEGALEAERVLSIIKKYNMNLSFPIYYDLESNTSTQFFNPTIYRNIINSFGQRINSSGYTYKIYTYTEWANTALNATDLRNQIDWIAHYNHYCSYAGNYSGWQYTSSDRISGISTSVDSSVFGNFVYHA